MQKMIKRDIQKSTQPYVRSKIKYLSNLELSKPTRDNFNMISDSRSSLLTVDSVEKDLKFLSTKAMKNIWG